MAAECSSFWEITSGVLEAETPAPALLERDNAYASRNLEMMGPVSTSL